MERDKEKIQEKYTKQKSELEDLKNKYNEINDLNVALQQNVLEAFKERKGKKLCTLFLLYKFEQKNYLHRLITTKVL